MIWRYHSDLGNLHCFNDKITKGCPNIHRLSSFGALTCPGTAECSWHEQQIGPVPWRLWGQNHSQHPGNVSNDLFRESDIVSNDSFYRFNQSWTNHHHLLIPLVLMFKVPQMMAYSQLSYKKLVVSRHILRIKTSWNPYGFPGWVSLNTLVSSLMVRSW